MCQGDSLVNSGKVESKTCQSSVENKHLSVADELKKLNDLKDRGALTQEEFELHKKIITIK